MAALTVSANLWFSTHPKLSTPRTLPLSTALQLELSRQLEMVIADALDDAPALVPAFLGALRRQLRACLEACPKAVAEAAQPSSGRAPPWAPPRAPPRAPPWAALQKARPPQVTPADWAGLFEFVLAKLCLWLPSRADWLAWLDCYCDEGRFDKLELRDGER